MNQKHKDPICFLLLLFKLAFRINQPSMTESFDKPKILGKEFKTFWWSPVQRWLSCWPNHLFSLRPMKFWLTAACISSRCWWEMHTGTLTACLAQGYLAPDVPGRQSAECLPSVRAVAPWLRTGVLHAAVVSKSDTPPWSLEFSSGSPWWQVWCRDGYS